MKSALYATAAVGVAADQITKAIALARLSDGESVPFIEGVWHWTLHRNPGAAFSLFTNSPIVFTVIAFVISIGIVWYARKIADRPTLLALGLILGGALGNLTDRIVRPPEVFRGHVIDFIDWRVWPTFNIADALIVSGAILLFAQSVRAERAERSLQSGAVAEDSTE